MSERKPNLLLPIGGALVLAAGGFGAFYLYQQHQQRSRVEVIAQSARFVPQGAVAGLSISNDPRVWQSLDRFQSEGLRELIQESTTEVLPADIDFARDIQPWMGQVFVAFLPSPAPQGAVRPSVLFTQTEPGAATKAQPFTGKFVAVVEVRDRRGAEQFFTTKVTPTLTSPPQESEYKGVTIFESGDTAAAFIDRFLVLTGDRATLQQSIDTFQGGSSFAVPEMELDLSKPLAQLYIPNVKGALEQFAKNSPNPELFEPLLERVQEQAESVVVGLGVEENGLRLQAMTKLGPEARPFQPSPGKVISQFPADTFMLLSGFNFRQTWQNILEQAKTDPEQQEGIDLIREGFRENLNLDLDNDIIAWMDGEVALGVIASDEGILQQTRAGVVAVVQTSDRPAAEAALQKIDGLATQFPFPVQVQSTDIGGVKVQEWTSTVAPGSLFSHGWHQPDTFFLAMGPLGKTIATKPANSLADSPSFQSIAGGLDTQNQGYFYLNLDKVWSIYAEEFLARLPEEQATNSRVVASAINGIAMTYSQPSARQAKVDIFLSLDTNPPTGGG